MAACVFHRLDSSTTTTTVGKHCPRFHYSSSENRIFVLWREREGVNFAKYNPVTQTPSGEVRVSNSGTALTNQRDNPILVAVSDTILFAIFYGSTGGTAASRATCSRSADGGATWSAEVNIGGTNDYPVAAYFDGTQVVLIVVGIGGGGVGAGDYGYAKSVGTTNVWGSVTQFYDSGGIGSVTPGTADIAQVQQARDGLYMNSATVGFFVGARCTDATATTNRMECWWTTDGWTTSARVLIKANTAAYTGGQQVRVISGRAWLMFNDSDNNNICYLAYSDNYGQTWTLVGTPTPIANEIATAGITPNGVYDFSLSVDGLNNLIICHGSETNNPGTYYAWRSTDPTSLTAWVMANICTYNPTVFPKVTTTMTSQAVIIGTDLYRVIDATEDAATDYYSLQFITIEDAGEEPEPPAPPEPEASLESGHDDNNMMFRIDLEDGRGYSIHTISAGCAMSWEEGDEATGVEVPILVIGNPSIDSTIQNPAVIDGLTRIETGDDMGYGRRTYIYEATSTIGVRIDPLRMIVTSPLLTITEVGERNVCRRAFFDYVFEHPDPNARIEVQVWVDGFKLNSAIFLEPTSTDGREVWRSLPTSQNVGSVVQFRFDETSIYPVTFNAWGIMRIEKGVRN